MGYRPRFGITPALLGRVEAVAALRERIQAAAVQVAWIPALQKDTRARNAHSSTAIEGNPLTLEQVRAVEAGEALPVPARARREVVNYFAALRHVEKQAAKHAALKETGQTHFRPENDPMGYHCRPTMAQFRRYGEATNVSSVTIAT